MNTKQLRIGNKISPVAGDNNIIIGEVVFVGKTANIPEALLHKVYWFVHKERKPFWIIVELDTEIVRDFDVLASYEAFDRIYKVALETTNELAVETDSKVVAKS
jgi:hypothetical protein